MKFSYLILYLEIMELLTGLITPKSNILLDIK
jgi:hypothetical protein